MAIKKFAKNYKVIAKNKYNAIVGATLKKYADSMIIDAIDGDIKLISNKKVVTNGGC